MKTERSSVRYVRLSECLIVDKRRVPLIILLLKYYGDWSQSITINY